MHADCKEIVLLVFSTNFTVSKTVLKSLGDCLMEMELYLSRQIPAAFQTVSINMNMETLNI